MPEIPNIRPVPQLPEYRWNAAAGQYINPAGNFVPRTRIRAALNTFIDGVTDTMDLVARQLISGDISLAQFQSQMFALSKQANLAGAAAESGGWYQMGSSEFGRVGQKLRGEYEYLRQLGFDIESGAQRLDGTLVRRTRMYGQQGRVSYYDSARARAMREGYDEEHSHTTPADHCEECMEQERRGWSPIGSLIPVGDRQCLSNCKCFFEYRKSATGETKKV